MTPVALLTISDSANASPETDQSLETVRNSLWASLELKKHEIVPDDVDIISSTIQNWADSAEFGLILTSGGTGFSQRDVTPEAIEPLLEKKAPGLVYTMISNSVKHTPFGVLSRPVAGVRKQSLIITLPGSQKAVTECLQSLEPILDHALEQLSLESTRQLHGPSHSHSHHHGKSHSHRHSHHHSHHHHHHSHSHSHHHGHSHKPLVLHELDSFPSEFTSPALRKRESPYPMISVASALDLIAQNTPVSSVESKKITEDLSGYILAEDVVSSLDIPNFRASIVDGYAVILEDCPGTFPVMSVLHAEPGPIKQISQGTVARITTGAPVPLGADSVVMVESTVVTELTQDGQEEAEVHILATNVKKGDNIREVGSDMKKGTLVMAKGELFSRVGGEVGLLASVGVNTVRVYKKPRIGVLSTGNELVDVSQEASEYGQVYDCNRPALIASLRSRNFEALDLGMAPDTPEGLEKVIKQAFVDENIDYLVTLGGVSMGELDLMKPLIEKVFRGKIHFGRVAMKPGKPTTFATILMEVDGQKTQKMVFALPGNPASAIVTLHLFVYPSLYRFSGHTFDDHCFEKVQVRLASDTVLDPRPEFHRVSIRQQDFQGKFELVAHSTGFQRSSRVGSMKGANGLLWLPSLNERGSLLKAGEYVDALIIG